MRYLNISNPGMRVGTAVLCVLLAGCTDEDGPDPDGLESETEQAVQDSEFSLRAAAELYLETEYERTRIEQLCMEAAGFEVQSFEPVRPTEELVDQYLESNLITEQPWFMVIPESFDEGQVAGGEPEAEAEEDSDDEEPEVPDGYWEDYDEAYIGGVDFEAAEENPDSWPVTGGCKGEVQERLFTEIGLGRTDVRAPEGLSEDALGALLREDPEWTAVSDAWGACLNDDEFPRFADPGEAHAYLSHARTGDSSAFEGVGGPRPDDAPWPEAQVDEFSEELLTVMSDCDASTGFTTVSQERWDHLSQELMIELEPEFWAWQENLRLALDQAASIIESGW